MARQINYTQVLQDEASFQLVRTNPKLTGNVKLTVDSNDKMWMNSIDANAELSKALYKRSAVDFTASLPSNYFKFFNSGNTPSEIVFALSESFDSTKSSNDYKDQYDFSKYFSGVKYLTSRRYEEKLSYFAPIFIKEDVPDYFLIFKIEDPLNAPIDQLKDQYPYDKENYLKNLFKNATIIKTFDLKETSNVGSYLREYVRNSKFPTSPLDVSYDENTLTNWNGILYDSGVFGSRGELLYDFYRSSNPLKFFEEFMTSGYERNGVIFPNILNMEFIFDDDTSDIYDFNRYLGVYVNAIELSKLDIDLDRAYQERGTWENTPRFRREFKEYEDVNINQDNINGVIIPVKNSLTYFSDFEGIFTDKDNMFFNYVSDRNGNLVLPKLSDPYNIDYDENNDELLSAKITLSDKKYDIGDFFGPGSTFLQDKGFSTDIRGHSYSYIKISQLSDLDAIKLYHPRGTRSDANGNYELIEGVTEYLETPNPGDHYEYHDIDEIVGNDKFYFSVDGTANEVVSAIAGCINNIRNISLRAFAYNDVLFIKLNMAGEFDDLYSLEFNSQDGIYSGVTINDITGESLISNNIKFEGGSRPSGNRLVLDAGHLAKVTDNFDNILVRTNNGWSKLKKVSKYIDIITDKNQIDSIDRSNSINEFFGKIVVVLELEETPKLESMEFLMLNKHRPSFGLLSFFPIKDFDFDFYSSEYLNFPLIDLYKYYFVPANVKLISTEFKYKVFGEGSIKVNEIIYNSGDVFTVSEFSEYSVESGDPVVSFDNDINTLGNRLDVPINDDNKELQSFPGFFLLKDPSQVVPEVDDIAFELKQKYLNGIASTEYDFYKENYSRDFALKSKIIPYITKWAVPDGVDSRSNPYRLNSELAFGFNNFSPDHEDRSQNPSNFTHEWFYIESKFNYTLTESTVKLNNSYFDEPFDLNKALTEDGYFVDYFTYTPSINGREIGKTQTRYSPIRKNNLDIYESFFKGFKINFKDYIDPTNVDVAGKPIFNSNSNRFEGYKFTTLLKTSKSDINDDTIPPIRYRFIEHKDFKFVILLIELNIGSYTDIHEFWNNVQSGALDQTVDNSNFLDLIDGDATKLFNSINGDYRISFSDVDGFDISDMSHTLLYSLANTKYNNRLDNFSTIKLSAKLNLNNTGAFTIGNNIESIANINYLNYPSDLSDEINRTGSSTFIIGRDNVLNSDRFIDSVTGFTPDNSSKLSSAGSNFVTLTQNNDIRLIDDVNNIIATVPTGIPTNYFGLNYTFKVMVGGELYFENLLEKLSFGEFKQNTNNLNSFIEYYSYSYDTELIENESSWYTSVPDVSNISKVDAIIAAVDDNKPSNYAFDNLIGYKYERAELDNSYDINRYDGGFSPLFKDLFTFNSKFKFNKNDIDELDLSNTKFNIDVNSFLRILNFNHIKISSTKILDLESDEEFEPTYELIDEIAIGRNPYDLFNSNWDYGFHHNYLKRSESIPVAGTLRIEEDDCFLSKIVNLRSDIELEQFKIDKVDDIDKVNLDDFEIVYSEKDNSIKGKINIRKAITSFLINDGISTKFEEFLSESTEFIGNYETIEDYIKAYIDINIVRLYELETTEFYTKEDRSLVEDPLSTNENINAIQFELLDDKGRADIGYKLNKNLRINKIDRFSLSFEFTKNLNSGTLISPKIKIKFI